MSLTPGAPLGPYTLRAELGHGGMGVVYTAQDPRLKRQVAINILPPAFSPSEGEKFPIHAPTPLCDPLEPPAR